jgi:hypothetical protein
LATVYFRFAARGTDNPERSTVLERLLVRASQAVALVDWRADALRVIAPGLTSMPPVATVALRGAATAVALAGAASPGPVPPGRWACIATPVHLNAGLSSVSMPFDGVLTLEPHESVTLAEDFNAIFGGAAGGAGARMRVCAAAVLVCEFDASLDVETHDPETLVGRDLFAVQPGGSDGGRLRRLMSELELWLFDHGINRARAAAGRPTVTGFWLWGGGPIGAAIPAVQGWTAGRDPLFAAFGNETRWPSDAGQGSGVIVSSAQPGSAEWRAVEECWLEPAAAALEAGALTRFELSAGARRFRVERGFNWKFWRRARPWWETFGITNEIDE